MTRGHPAGFLTTAQATTLSPTWLLELNTGLVSPNDVLRYTTDAIDTVFPDGGDTYTAKAFQVGTVKVDRRGGSPNSVSIEDADGTIKQLIEVSGADFDRQRCTLYRIDRASKATSDLAQKDTYLVERAKYAAGAITFELLAFDGELLDTEIPLRSITVETFPGITEAS